MSIVSIEKYGSIYFFDSVINVFHKILILNSFCTQIDNKQEINLKTEDIFIIIEKVYTEGVYKCSLILVVVAYATLSIFWRETLNM
jgi:hypothetical protein